MTSFDSCVHASTDSAWLCKMTLVVSGSVPDVSKSLFPLERALHSFSLCMQYRLSRCFHLSVHKALGLRP